MATSHSEKYSDVSAPEEGTSQTYHVGEKATQPAPPKRRDSKLGHVMDSLRRSFSTEHKGSLERKSSQHEAHLQKVREQDSIDRARAAEEMMWESAETKESTSPAVEARRNSWGWPGLGTTDDVGEEPHKRLRASKTAGPATAMELRTEAAAYEAFDNTAENENYGWPGLGGLPGPR
ncbi:hypothetical protein LTR10_017817 [Elasticomyces elasticus]|uniref:Uncharacterized protein n=1 Tax=Exophiala sideris TaxID=1016849 RepID=A0ABR0J1A0_9EURO|nr:hypothetical protein LTR10_017817 [Elasticomyces elasticus]KAK5023816.1 hypothetical protein LTS07_008941 [Exophiala sideris]KAK5030165.1 hypothetical protein LTR13_008478 [Exophiala sideris]KAK5053660.1 hypothetical protein LTR69_009305 [Exophiala sideris]KAK5179297.1 hypothetical protein LTR44_008135 [Eurotiomycetes sp. CCFEE 6388]